MRQARYALIVVEAAESGVGIYVRDLLRDESLFVVDIGLSQTASVGMALAARLVAPEGFVCTTGAALPFGMLLPENRPRVMDGLRKLFPGADLRQLSPEETSLLTARVIRMCLEQGAAERIEYVGTERWSAVSRRGSGPPPARRMGRNDSCPCGSGRKFKHCCGRR
jgi:hypothetical protein